MDNLVALGLLPSCAHLPSTRHHLGHYLMHIIFSSGTFSKVCVGVHYHCTYYLPRTKKFGSWTREVTLPVKEAKSGSKRSGILGSKTSSGCFAVH